MTTERDVIWHKTGRILGAYRFAYDTAGVATLEELDADGWRALELGNLAAGGSSGEAGALADLTDVALAGLSSGQVLKWNGSAWSNATDLQGSGGGALADGDYGDIVVTASGSDWRVESGAISLDKMQARAEATFLGREAGAGAGTPQEITAAEAKAILALTTADVTGLDAALANKQGLDPTLTALGALTGTGLVEQTGADLFAKRALGVAASTSVPTRADADARYAATVHSHAQADITGLSTTLAGKAELVHVHPISDVTGLSVALSGKAEVSHGHTVSDVAGLQPALDGKAPLASPALTGTPTSPTPTLGDSTTKIATTAFVQSSITAGGGYTDEAAQDATGSMVLDTATIDLTYNDAGPTLSADLKTGSVGTTHLGGDITAAGKALLDDATAAAQLTTLGAAAASHSHAQSDITNLPTDLANRQPLDATLTALAGLSATTGLVEQTGVDTFGKRAMGVAASTSVLTRADGDGRYATVAHSHAIADTTGLQTALDGKAPLASPALTGTPTVPTAGADTNTTQAASCAYVQGELTDRVPTTRTVTAGAGLTGGGDLSANRTLALDLNSLTADPTPDAANDYIATWDASATAHKKVLLSNLPGGGGGGATTLDGLSDVTVASPVVGHSLRHNGAGQFINGLLGAADITYTEPAIGAVARTVKLRLDSQSPSVKDFSSNAALGDGIVNATSAFQAAYDSGEPDVTVPPGVYPVGNVVPKAGVVFRGLAAMFGTGAKIIPLTGMSGYQFNTGETATDLWGFQNIDFDADAQKTSTTLLGAIAAGAAKVVLINYCRFFNYPNFVIDMAPAGSTGATNQSWKIIDNYIGGCARTTLTSRAAALRVVGADHEIHANEIHGGHPTAISNASLYAVALWLKNTGNVEIYKNIIECGDIGVLLDNSSEIHMTGDRIEVNAGHGMAFETAASSLNVFDGLLFFNNSLATNNTYDHIITNGFCNTSIFRSPRFSRNAQYSNDTRWCINDTQTTYLNRYINPVRSWLSGVSGASTLGSRRSVVGRLITPDAADASGDTQSSHKLTDLPVKTTAYSLTVDDSGTRIPCSHASTPFTITVPTAATLGNGFSCEVINTGAAAITVNGPSASDISLATNDSCYIFVTNGVLYGAKGAYTAL